MKKRFLNLLLALALVVCVLPMAADAASCGTHNKNNTKLVPAKAATCVTPGNIEHYVCEACGKTFVAKNATSPSLDIKKNVAVPATSEHTYVLDTSVNDGYREGDEATCTKTGIFVLKCSTTGCTATTAQLAPVNKDRHTPVKGICSGCGVCVNNHTSCEIVTKAADPTCGAPGARYTIYRCKVCDIFFCNGVYKTTNDFPDNVIPATGEHTLSSSMKSYLAPTCQKVGEATYECTVCHADVVKEVAKLTCNIVKVDAVAPTCNNPGKTEGTKCDSCNNGETCTYCKATLKAQEEVAKLGHDMQCVKINKKATCDEDGEGVFDCSRCGYDGRVKVIPAPGHTDVEEILRDATCTRDGWKEVTCSNEGCGKCITVKIPATGHTAEAIPEDPATCTATGLTAGEKCSVCGEVFTAQTVVEKLPHAWEDVEAQDPTCKADGYNAHKACTECGETDGKTVIPASAAYHEYENFKCKHCGAYDPSHQHQGTGVVTTESTCTAEGVKSFECTGCGHTWTESVAKKPHTYNAKARCTECGALDPDHQHNYVQTDYRAPTCTVEGKVTKKCSVCDDLTETLIDANGHSYENGKCVGCGIAAACAHDHTTTTVESNPTCKRAGKKVTTCDSCGKTVGTEVIPATGKHNYVNNRCTGCGQNDPSRITNDFQDVFIVG